MTAPDFKSLFGSKELSEVFVAGGQPSITYVRRDHLGLEAALKKPLAQGNVIVSLTGATKAGKTVLCHSVLLDKEYVWIDGGVVRSEDDFWSKVASELKAPYENEDVDGSERR